MTYSNGKIVVNAQAAEACSVVDNAPSSWCSPLALWTGVGAASILSGNRDVDRIVLGTTAIIAISCLMNMAQAQCEFSIYFNLPNYVQDSVPTDGQNGIKYVSFINLQKRAKVSQPYKVKGGTCSLGQCGGPSSAGPGGCQCDALCTSLGDCCADYAKSCQKVNNPDGSVSILNDVKDGISFFSQAAGHSSCKGKCGGPSLDGKCMCDDRCHLTKDCCAPRSMHRPSAANVPDKKMTDYLLANKADPSATVPTPTRQANGATRTMVCAPMAKPVAP